MNIIPHDELAEGECAEEYLLFNVPPGLRHDGLPDSIEDRADIDTMFVSRQGFQPANGNTKIQPDHFQQGNIHDRILFGAAYNECLLCGLADYFYGQ